MTENRTNEDHIFLSQNDHGARLKTIWFKPNFKQVMYLILNQPVIFVHKFVLIE